MGDSPGHSRESEAYNPEERQNPNISLVQTPHTHNSVVEGKDLRLSVVVHGGESTPFAFDTVENSMRITVDGNDIRVAFSLKNTKGTPELVIRLWHGYTIAILLRGPKTPIYSPGPFHHEAFHETIP